jgi:hypothetical protein
MRAKVNEQASEVRAKNTKVSAATNVPDKDFTQAQSLIKKTELRGYAAVKAVADEISKMPYSETSRKTLVPPPPPPSSPQQSSRAADDDSTPTHPRHETRHMNIRKRIIFDEESDECSDVHKKKQRGKNGSNLENLDVDDDVIELNNTSSCINIEDDSELLTDQPLTHSTPKKVKRSILKKVNENAPRRKYTKLSRTKFVINSDEEDYNEEVVSSSSYTKAM